MISQSWDSERRLCCCSAKSTSTRPASWVNFAMRATFSRAVTSRWADTEQFLPRTTMSICTSRGSATRTHPSLRCHGRRRCPGRGQRDDDAAHRRRGARTPPRRAWRRWWRRRRPRTTRAGHGPAGDEPRAPAAGVAGEPGLRGPGRRSRRPTQRAPRPAGDRPGEQLGGVEAPRRRRSRLVGAQVTTPGSEARVAAGTAATIAPASHGTTARTLRYLTRATSSRATPS